MGKIFVGTTEIKAGELKIGTTEVKQVFVGTTKIWENFDFNAFRIASTELSTGFDTSNVKTLSNVPIGLANASRQVIVCFQTQGANGHTVVSVTIGGVSATIRTTSLGNTTCTIAFAAVPSGTTATVVVTTSATPGNSAVGGLIAGTFYPSPAALGVSASTANNLVTGVATVTALASKLTLYATAAQGLSPASSMNMTLVNGIQTFYNPVDHHMGIGGHDFSIIDIAKDLAEQRLPALPVPCYCRR